MRKPLTDTLLRALKKPAKGRTELADAACRGLEFRITAAGNQSWSYRYRAAGSGKLSRATIGPYPGISLADARLKADAMRAGVSQGENPSEAKRRAKREAPGRTFKALADRYMKEYARRPYGKRLQAKRSADQDERNLNLHVLPKWKDRDYATLRRADVIELIEGLITGATARDATGAHAPVDDEPRTGLDGKQRRMRAATDCPAILSRVCAYRVQ